MPATPRYLTSLYRSFSTFLAQNYVSGPVARQAEAIYLKLLGWKKDYHHWSVEEVNQFLTQVQLNTPVLPQVESLLTQFVKDFPPHQANIFLHEYLLAIKQNQCSSATIRNYRSDIRQFVRFSHTGQLKTLFTKPKLAEFVQYQLDKGLKESSITRKLSSIAQFGWWLQTEGLLDQNLEWIDQASVQSLSRTSKTNLTYSQNKIKPPQAGIATTKIQFKPGTKTINPVENHHQHFNIKKRLRRLTSNIRQVVPAQTRRWLLPYLNLAFIVLVFLGLGYFGYRQLFVETPSPFAYPSTPTRPNRVLSFQGRLTDSAQNPLTTSTNMRFYLYDALSGGTQLWDSSTCAVTPDQDGIFTVNLGSDCGAEIGANVFSENANIWLEASVEAETLTPRQPIRTVAYALNAETVQGYPIDSSGSATANTLLTMDSVGDVVLGEVSPKIRSVSGTFTLEGEALSLTTVSGSNGDITLDPDGVGGVNLLADVSVGGYLEAPGATLSATYAGGTALNLQAGPSATADVMQWQDSAGSVLGVIDSGGKLGVGDSSPTALLTVGANDLFQVNSAGIIASIDGVAHTLDDVTGDLTLTSNSTTVDIADSLSVAGNITATGNLTIPGTTTFNSLTYTWPATQTANYVLQTDGSGTLSWVAQSGGGGGGSAYWRLSAGALSPVNDTLDFLVGANASASAKFAVLNVDSGTPTASVSAGVNGATYLTADGTLQTTANQTLTLGGATTGDIYLNGKVGVGVANPATALDVSGKISINGDQTIYNADQINSFFGTLIIGDGGTNLSHSTGSEAYYNTTVGLSSLTQNTTGYLNTSVGNNALNNNTTGNFNTAIGASSMGYNISGSNNTALGYLSLYGNGSGSNNVAIGSYSGPNGAADSVSNNTLVGFYTGANLISGGDNNTILGYLAGDEVTTGANNILIGNNAGDALDTGSNNIIIGVNLDTTAVGASNELNIGGVVYGDLGAKLIGIGTASPISKLQLTGAVTGKALAIFDETGDQNIFTASSSGTPKFTLDNSGRISLLDGVAHTIDDVSGNLTLTSNSSTISLNDNVSFAGTTTLNSLTYAWPTTQTANYVLQTNGSGTLSWTDPAGAVANAIPWVGGAGVLYPKNSTLDLLVGGQATSSAKFAILNMDSGTPTASISGTTSNVSTYLTGEGNLATTNMAPLTLGGATTGPIQLSPKGNAGLYVIDGGSVGIGTTSPNHLLDVAGNIGLSASAYINWGATDGSTGYGLRDNAGAIEYKDSGGSWSDFTTIANNATIWTDGGSYVYPTNLETLGDSTSGGANKLTGIYLADSSPLTIGTDNDISFSFTGSELTTTLGSNTWNIASNLLFLNGSTSQIGIGTNSPLATLDIQALSGTTPVASISGNTSMANLIVDQSGSGDIFAASSSGQTRFVVAGDGNVGIGVQDPTSRLEIGGSTSTISNSSGDITLDSASNFISLAGDSLGNLLNLSVSGDASISGSIAFDGISPNTIDILNGNRLDFQTSVGGDAGLGAIMSLTNGGNVGIGTTAPNHLLDVAGNIGLSASAYINWGATDGSTGYGLRDNAGTMEFKNSGGSWSAFGTGGGWTYSTPYLYPDNATDFVGIGTTTTADMQGLFTVSGARTGKALAIFNETGDQDIIVASASGTTRFRVGTDGYTYAARFVDTANSTYYLDPAATGTSLNTAGDITVNSGSGKINVGTIDPPYTINGEKYATYVTSMTGVKEETTGLAYTNQYIPQKGYRYSIDFANQDPGSDLWLFAKTTKLKQNLDQLVVLLSPAGNTRAWYTLDTKTNQLHIYSSRPTAISYRLTAPRFDAQNWSNSRDDQTLGFVLNDPDEWEINPDGNIIGEIISAISETFDSITSRIAHIETIVTPTIELTPDETDPQTGLSQYATLEITDSHQQPVATFNSQGDLTLLGELNTATISAITASISGQLSARSARLDQLEAKMAELEHIKAQTAQLIDATISGTLYATKIEGLDDQLATTLNSMSFLDKLLNKKAQATASASVASVFSLVENAGYATASANTPNPLSNPPTYTGPSNDVSLVASAVFIDNYFSVNGSGYIAQQLGIGEQVLVGTTLALGKDFIQHQPLDDSTSDTFYIQPSGTGTLSLMAGLINLDENGQVLIDGDLAVAGNVEIGGTLLTDLIAPTDFGQPFQLKLATQSGIMTSTQSGVMTGSVAGIATASSRFEILNQLDLPTATISAQGRASFEDGLNIGTEDLTPISTMSATIVATQPSGKATIRQGTLGITIKSSRISQNSLIYVSPIGSTNNQVLYVKSQTPEDLNTLELEGSFSVGFDVPINHNVTFNWWIIN